MIHTKSNRKAKTKSTVQRKSSRRKTSGRTFSGTQGKKNKHPVAHVQDSPQPDKGVSHEQIWWDENVKKMASLVKCCGKSYGWDHTEVNRILESYRQFLVLKKEHADWNGTKLHPCWPVKEVWKKHNKMTD